MIRRVCIVMLSGMSILSLLFAGMMWTSDSIYSLGDASENHTKVRLSFQGGGAMIEYDGPRRSWWPRGTYNWELIRADFDLVYVGSTIAPPDLTLKSSATVTLRPLCSILFANAGVLLGTYPLITLIRGPLRRKHGKTHSTDNG